MMWRTLALAVLCASLAPATAAAQAEVLSDARLAPVHDRLAQSVDAAQREGLPSEWLLEKVAEGLSKHVSAPRIAAAVDTLLTRIRSADTLVRAVPGARGEERRRLLRAAVDALAAGAPHDGLGRLLREVVRRDRSDAPRRAHDALTTVAELAERHFGGRAAVEATTDAYRQGRRAGLNDLLRRARQIGPGPPNGRDEALRSLGRAVGRGQIGGVDPGERGRDHGRDGQPGHGLR